MSINKIMISGNLTRDAELKETRSGTSRLAFTVAVNRGVRGQDGVWRDEADFIPCVLFGNRAVALAPYMRKGVKAAVSGRLSQHSWIADDGSRRSALSLVADDIDLMSRGGQEEASQEREAYSGDDIPF